MAKSALFAISGKIFYLKRPNVDTDQIIPAVYLTGVSIKGLGSHLFEGVPDFDREDPAFQEKAVLVAGENFGCGSSREHAVWALEDHGFMAVIAPSFARIFRQNAFNRGLLLIEHSPEAVEMMFTKRWEYCRAEIEEGRLHFWSGDPIEEKASIKFGFSFQLSEFEKMLVIEGGLVGFAAKRYPEGAKR